MPKFMRVFMASILAMSMLGSSTAYASEYDDEPLNGWDLNGIVRAVKIVGDVVYVGGDFAVSTSPNGSMTNPRLNLAAFRRSDGTLLPFRADTNGTVTAIEATDSTVWIAGSFSMVRSTARSRIAAVSAGSGSVITSFDVGTVNGAINDLELVADDLYMAGSFTSVDSSSRARLAAVDAATGSLQSGPSLSINATVEAIAADSDDLYLTGSFTTVAGKSRSRLASIDLDSNSLNTVTFANLNSRGLDVAVSGNSTKVFVGVGGGSNRVKAWDTGTGNERWQQIVDGDVRAVAWHDGSVYAGFHDGFQGNKSIKLLVLDDTTGALGSYKPAVDQPHQVRAIDANDYALVAGGDFDTFDGVATRRIAIVPATDPPASSPPTTPKNLRVTSLSDSTVTLTWGPSSDPEHGIASYRLFRNGNEVASTLGTTLTDVGLRPLTAYRYTVQAVDHGGAKSSLSAEVKATTARRAGTRFIDDDDSIFEDDIEWLAARGITKGCNPPTNDRYCPDDPVTRGQMAAFLRRMFLAGVPSQPNPFTDDDASVFEADIAILAANGATKGCNPPANDRYCPDDSVTRGQMAAFLNRLLVLAVAGPSPFVDDDESVFEADIAQIAEAGITRGCNPPANDRFCPDDPVTRGQMAAFLRRASEFPVTSS